MSNFVEIIKECESANGAGTKEAIKAALLKADTTAQKLIHYAMDPFRVFGVRKYEMPIIAPNCTMSQVNYDKFFEICDKLAARELTGDAGRAAVSEAIGLFPEEAHAYVARIFDKDLKAGFSADTFNKIHKKNPIPTFEVMLADKCDSTEDFEKYVKFPCMADFKYDGERTIAIVKEDSITYYSRSGKEATHVNGLFDEELVRIREHLGTDFVLDGERYASNFTETMNAKKSGNDEAKKNLRFRAFFLMPYSHWVAQSTQNTMRSSRQSLERILKEIDAVKIVLSEGREVADYQDMMTFCNEAIDVHKVEGLILKDWDATYQWDRTFAWTKVKRFYDADCRIVGFYPGRLKSRLENTLGGITVVGFLEDGTRVECNVGSGFSDELRSEIWNNKEKWMGRTVVIKYQEVSKAKGKEYSSLRFPTYERDRDDKIVEI